ncbi:MAG: 50S ribosomal protein L32 [Chitinophagales bacterium]
MAHPKRKISKQRRDKRRTHVKAAVPHIVTCKVTGAAHKRHQAYEVDGKLYYKGKLLIDTPVEE